MTRLSIGAMLVIIGSIFVVAVSELCNQKIPLYGFSYDMDPVCNLIIYCASGILVIFGIIVIVMEAFTKK
ncbi:MAG: hypothetical protein ACW97V_20025 [Promethearchaeota archaeon]